MENVGKTFSKVSSIVVACFNENENAYLVYNANDLNDTWWIKKDIFETTYKENI